MDTLETRLKAEAARLGFEPVGIAPAVPADDFDRLRDWLARGFAGEMDYMHRHADARRHPSSVLREGAQRRHGRHECTAVRSPGFNSEIRNPKSEIRNPKSPGSPATPVARTTTTCCATA